MKNQQSREKSAESVSPRYKLRGLNRDAFFDEQISMTPKGLTHALKCGAKSFECIEDHLKENLDEFICVTDCDSKPSLVEEMKKELTWLKYTTGLAATETIVGGYLTLLPQTGHPLLTTATILATGLLGYSAYHAYDTSKQIKEMEKILKDKLKTD